MKLLALSVLFSGYLVAFVSFCQVEHIQQKTRGFPWPMPKNMISNHRITCLVNEEISFDFGSLASCDLMTAAEQRAFRYMRSSGFHTLISNFSLASSFLSLVVVRLTAQLESLPDECRQDSLPKYEMDESYHVKVSCESIVPRARVTANTVWGLIRGIETFTQLIYMDRDGNRIINDTTINDSPSFPWRGVMLDTSRRFLPVPLLLKNLEVMAINKFNVFHWHIVDNPSFPWVSETFPQMSANGAYPPTPLHIYSPSDVEEVLRQGRLLGIRIVPEFDTPGHTGSWGAGLPHLLTTCYNKKTGKPDGSFGPFDLSNPSLWKHLAAIFEEVNQVFLDGYVHLGGDEVFYGFDCWLNNPSIKKFMSTMNLTTAPQLQSYYTKQQLRLLDVLTKKAGKYLFWEDVFNYNISLPSDRSIIQVWSSNQSKLASITKSGHQAIYSSCWYLDDLKGTEDWRGMYSCDPLAFPVDNLKQLELVKGGEACLWGKYIDATNMLQRLWPRGSAAAERLWTNPRSKNTVAETNIHVGMRLEEHRCRMVARGIPAQPVEGPGYCDIEYHN